MSENNDSKIIYTREELISICQDAVVHHKEWCNRDSFLAQQSINSIHKGLTAGLDFNVIEDGEDILRIEFSQPIDLEMLNEYGEDLEISDIDEYYRECDPERETEMFPGGEIDFNSDYTTSYMPTRKRLESVGVGFDWYK